MAPVPYTGFGFLANLGGVIDAPVNVTINTSGLGAAYGAWSNGGGSLINFSGGASIATLGVGASGYFASHGGLITATGASNVSVSGDKTAAVQAAFGGQASLNGGGNVTSSGGTGSIGLLSTGSGSIISATGANVQAGLMTSTGAIGVKADNSASASLSGGSVTTFGDNAIDVVSTGSATVTLSSVGIIATGDGSTGLAVDGSGSKINGSGLIVTIMGNGSGLDTGAAINAGSNTAPNGGALTLTNSTLQTTGGTGTFGIYTANGGITALVDDTISTAGDNAFAGVESGPHGSTTIQGGSISTGGLNSIGLYASGLGAKATTGPDPMGVATTIATLLDNSPGVQADGGGLAQLTGGAVTTSGDGSPGLFVTSTGSAITASGVVVATSGGFGPTGLSSVGVLADSGGVATFSGGSITTNGSSAFAVVSQGAGSSVTVNGLTTVLTLGNGSGGLAVYGAGASLTANGISVATQGGVDSSDGFVAYGAYNGFGPGFSTGGSMSLTNTSITTSGVGASGVVANSGGVTTVSGGSVTTSGDNAFGLWASGAGSSITTTGGTTIATGSLTGGSFAYGARAETGGALTLNGGSVTTMGANSIGLFATGAGSSVASNGTTITTSGLNSTGVLADSGGSASLTGGSVNTSADGAYAVVVHSGGFAALSGTTIGTLGDGSGGLGINGAGSEIDATSVTISTKGVFDPVSGLHSYGVANTPFGSFTSGGVAKLMDTSISTQGAQMYGVITSTGGSTTIAGGSINTAGTLAFGVLGVNGGSTTIAKSAAGPTKITTTGASANAIDASEGGSVQVSGAQITTSANGAHGLVVTGSASTLTASGVSVSTQGGVDTATGFFADGAYNGPGGVDPSGGSLTLANSTVATSGPQAFAVITSVGGSTTISGGSFTTSGLGADGIVTVGGGSTIFNGASVATSGQDAHAFFVGPGSQASLGGTNTFSTQGDGAIGLYATLGGVINGTGLTSITTTGGVSPATGLSAFGVNADGAGSQIKLASATITTSGAGATGLFASDVDLSGSAGAITVSGPLNLKTTNAAAAAVGLQGDGASIFVAGGGSITSAGDAIQFLGGTNQTATFDNLSIANQTGDLIFADPSVATVNFNATTANAGFNNLLNATAGSIVTLNASGSNLTGAIQTDSASTSTLNLTNGSQWIVTGSSVVSNLAVANSIVVFAPPGSGVGFKTLTLGNYTGSGAGLTMNVALGGSSSAADQLIINGGKASGSTLLTIHNVGGLGAQTTGNGIPLIIATNGGSLTSSSFALANTPVVGGFRYTLDETSQDVFLVSSPASTINDIANSVTDLARSRQQQIITNRVLTSILLGATEQISCANCSSGFGSIGSYALGAHGRWSLSDQLTLMGGFSYGEYTATGVTVSDAPTVAASLVYDPTNFGRSRPFVEVGLGLTPYEQVQYSRSYLNGLTTSVGNGTAINRNAAIFGRVGWVDRLTPIDEAAIYGDLSRNWMQAGGFTEGAGPNNPFPATVQSGVDVLNVARLGGQYTHLFAGKFEANVSAAVAYGFDAGTGSQVNVFDFGEISPFPIKNSYWLEYGARIGYRFGERTVIDAFVLGTAGGEIGTTFHGGVGLRYLF
jgi:hypothetical protein